MNGQLWKALWMANPLKSFWPIYFGTSELCCYCLQSVFLQGMLFGGQKRYSCPIPLVKKLVLHKCKQWLFNPGKCSTSTRQQLTTWISCMFSSGNLHQCGRTLIQDILAESYYQIQVIKCFAKWPLRLSFWIFVSNFGGLSKMRRPVYT